MMFVVSRKEEYSMCFSYSTIQALGFSARNFSQVKWMLGRMTASGGVGNGERTGQSDVDAGSY